MKVVQPSSFSSPPSPPPPDKKEDDAFTTAAAWGCAILFVASFFVAGALPFLALLHVLPKSEQAFGGTPSFLVLSVGVAFLAAGVYMARSLLRRLFPRSFSGWSYRGFRVLADIIVAALAVPFHWYVFFGKPTAGSTGLILPGGIVLFANLKWPLEPILDKFIVAILAILLDMILLSEIFGLGWIRWEAGGKKGDDF